MEKTAEALKELKIKYLVLDEKFNTTLRNKIEETIQNESRQDDDEMEDDEVIDTATSSSLLPPKVFTLLSFGFVADNIN